MNLLITGGAGFIGSNFIQFMLERHPEHNLVNFDCLTYAGNLENLQSVEKHPRYAFVKGDICDAAAVEKAIQEHGIEAIVHFAAESHVDRSILGSEAFIRTNVLGTSVLLEMARKYEIKRFLHVSTDEVYGSLGATGYFTESTNLHPNSPYAASKAASDLVALSFEHTHHVPVLVTRCSNNYGAYQFPEKLIPLMIINALHDKPLPVYGDGMNVRDWLHVRDHCSALATVLYKGTPGEIYNIGGNNEWHNIDIVKTVLSLLGKPESLITFVKDRPGHDRRYAIDSSKLQTSLGWKPSFDFGSGLAETVRWYIENRTWWERTISGEYRAYYEKQYGNR